MQISSDNQFVYVTDFGDLSLKHTFECGQCFRWVQQKDGSYSGIVQEMDVNLAIIDSPEGAQTLRISGVDEAAVRDFWINYLDLNTDYNHLCGELCLIDKHIKNAIDFSRGLRLLRQPFFETLISFIVSQNNNVPRITGIIDKLCTAFGDELTDGRFAFPTPEGLSRLTVDDFTKLGAGYRSAYLYAIAQKYVAGEINPKDISSMNYLDARNFLISLPGVGPKVADCVLLFSGVHSEAFPTDVWVKRTMLNLYGLKTAEEITAFAATYFGEKAGIAQQYLFHYARKGSGD